MRVRAKQPVDYKIEQSLDVVKTMAYGVPFTIDYRGVWIDNKGPYAPGSIITTRPVYEAYECDMSAAMFAELLARGVQFENIGNRFSIWGVVVCEGWYVVKTIDGVKKLSTNEFKTKYDPE